MEKPVKLITKNFWALWIDGEIVEITEDMENGGTDAYWKKKYKFTEFTRLMRIQNMPLFDYMRIKQKVGKPAERNKIARRYMHQYLMCKGSRRRVAAA